MKKVSGDPCHQTDILPDRLRFDVFTPQKCDVKRPCSRCVAADEATKCEHEVASGPTSVPDHAQFVFWNAPDPSGSKDLPARGPWVIRGAGPEPGINFPPVSTTTQLPPETIPRFRALVPSLVHNGLLPATPPGPPIYPFSEVRACDFPHVPLPSFSAISSLVFPTNPQDPHVMSSFLGGERFQLSDTALGDLDMKLYVSRVR